jgi:hypothetical protein
MKRLPSNFQPSMRTASTAFLVALIFPALAVYAGNGNGSATTPSQAQAPPAWMSYELNAIHLLETGFRQESSDPQGAVATLQHAREESTAAIAHGGGTSAIVMHNDHVIAETLMSAEKGTTAAATPAPESNEPVEMPKTGGTNLAMARASTHHSIQAQAQTSTKLR